MNHPFQTSHFPSLCCPLRGYGKTTVYAIVRASSTTVYLFTNGATLTVGPKLRVATFPHPGHEPRHQLEGICAELSERHPLTRNKHVSINQEAFPVVSELTLKT